RLLAAGRAATSVPVADVGKGQTCARRPTGCSALLRFEKQRHLLDSMQLIKKGGIVAASQHPSDPPPPLSAGMRWGSPQGLPLLFRTPIPGHGLLGFAQQ